MTDNDAARVLGNMLPLMADCRDIVESTAFEDSQRCQQLLKASSKIRFAIAALSSAINDIHGGDEIPVAEQLLSDFENEPGVKH